MWTIPVSFHVKAVRQKPVGEIFDHITNGVRSMPAYGAQIPPEDRWAIVLYLRALQKSRNATIANVPENLRQYLSTPKKANAPSMTDQKSTKSTKTDQ